MIDPGGFFEALQRRGFGFFTGVPDSLLKDFCAYVTDHTAPAEHIIAANEGAAVALAAGHYLATGRPGLVYMQNSGQGNAINPLTSLADPDVFGIPMLLLVGWRGEPGRKDEPQHVKQGKVTREVFDAIGVPNAVLPPDMDAAAEMLRQAVETMHDRTSPYALIVRDGTFAEWRLKTGVTTAYELNREGALRLVVDAIADARPVVVATTGKTSRELFEHRQSTGQAHGGDFRTVGCMGHASQIALGIALAKPDRQVFCLDGDGAVIMHMGALALIGAQKLSNFKHVVINNGCHDSVGGQPTVGFAIDIPQVARACGYRMAASVETAVDLSTAIAELLRTDGPAMLEVRVNKGARANLGRPTSSPSANKYELMQHLGA